MLPLAHIGVFLPPSAVFIQLNWISTSGTLKEAEKHRSDLRHRSGLLMSVFLWFELGSMVLGKQTGGVDLGLCPAC